MAPLRDSTKDGPVQTRFLNGNGKLADKLDMVPAPSWRDQFKIDDKILKSFWGDFSQSSPIRASELTEAGAASSTEFVLWCIREGHFSEEAFLRYQSKACDIPVVSGSFFEAPIDHDFWNRVRDLHPWTSDCLPLTEWDGILLVASVWPTQTFKASLHHRLVLATPTQLREFHKLLQSKSTATVPATPNVPATPAEPREPAVPAAPAESAALEVSSEADNGDPFASLSRSLGLSESSEDSPAHSEGEAASEEAPEGLIIPEGLSFSSEEISRLDLNQEPAAELSLEPEPDSAPKPEPVPEPIVLAPPKSAEPKVAPKAETKSPPPPPPPVMPFSPVVTPDAPAMVKPVAPKAPPPPPPVNFSLEKNTPVGQQVAPTKPPAEATVVVSADDVIDHAGDAPNVPSTSPEATAETPKVRRPLFEPSSSEKPASPATKSVSGGAAAPPPSVTQTGTATRARRLESTPLTSFFGPGGLSPNPVNAKSAVRSAPASPKYSNHVISLGKIEPVHLDQCTTVDEAGAQALLQVCNIFETGMILLFKDGTLQPWKWTDLLLSVKGDSPDDIDLREPSIFKVVFRTAKPYHGYVVTSTVNQKFFNEFNRGLLPKHATAIPIMIDGRMGGMILGITNAKIDYRQSLRLMERLGFDLARVFKMLRGSVAKAS